MRFELPIRASLASVAIFFVLGYGSYARGGEDVFNPLRNESPPPKTLMTDHEVTARKVRDDDVAPVVWQSPVLEALDPPPAPSAEFGQGQGISPPELSPELTPDVLQPETNWDPAAEQDALHWPDESYAHDPNVSRGPLRQHIADMRRFFSSLTGLGLDQSGRYVGLGIPLTDTSWLNRPWSFGAFLGTQMHDDLIGGQIGQSNSAVAGMRLGLDFDYYWGLEARFAYSNPDTFVPGVPQVIGNSHNYYVDLNLMYYPWGDSRWRPYLSAGLGAGTFRFRDVATGVSVSDSGLRVPLAIGVKYFQSPWFTLRFDAQFAPTFMSDNFDTQSEFMLNMGAEIRFGGNRQSYFPWHSGTAYW